MGIRFDLDQIINQVGRDRGIERDVLIEAIESAVLSAAKKHYGQSRNIEVQFNPDLKEIEVLEFKVVVSHVNDSLTQVTVAQALEEFGIEAELGEELGKKLPTEELGRIPAQTAKQVIAHKMRDAERGIIYEEFRGRKGEVVNGIVQRFDRGGIVVNLGRTDALLPRREQVSRERYQQNDRVRAMIIDIDSASRGPQVILSRSHPDFVKKLFEQEVPEISEGIIEVKNVAREPGERAKIAVYSTDPGVDPRGACIGIKGSRVQAVVSELRGERIEIVLWSPDAPSFVARSLAPAEVLRVVVDEDEKSMEVVVADDQLSAAIGRQGQNVRLASKLTGWKIDVRSESVAEEELKKARSELTSIGELGLGEAELLYQDGFRTVKEVAASSIEDIAAIEGIQEGRAEVIKENAGKRIDEMEQQAKELGADEIDSGKSNLHLLILPDEVRGVLVKCGYRQIQTVAAVDVEELATATGLPMESAELVANASSAFLKAQKEAEESAPQVAVAEETSAELVTE